MKRLVSFLLLLSLVVLSLASCSEGRELEKSANALLEAEPYKVKVTTGYFSYDTTVNSQLKNSGGSCYITIDGDNFFVERPVPGTTQTLYYTYINGVLYANESVMGSYKYEVPQNEYKDIYDGYVSYNMANEDFKLSNYKKEEVTINSEGYTVISASGVKSSLAKNVEKTLASSVGSGTVLVDSDECKLVITLDGLGRYKSVVASYYTVVSFSATSQTVVTMTISYEYTYGSEVKVELPADYELYPDVNDESYEWY